MKKLLSILLAVLLTLSVMPAFAEGQTEEPAEETPSVVAADSSTFENCLQVAINAIVAEDYESAKDYLGVCFGYCDPQTNPSAYADLLLRMACINVIEEKYDIAQLNLNSALRLQPDLADAYFVRVEVYAALGDAERTIESFEKYIELSGDTSWYETLAELYAANGDMTAAVKAQDLFVEGEEDPAVEAVYQAGYYRMQVGSYEEAVAIFEGIADNPDYGAGAMFNIAFSKMMLGDFAGAAEAYTGCEEKGGNYEGLYYYRGLCHWFDSAWAEAAADMAQSVEKESFNDATYYLACSQMMQDDNEAAIANFTAYIEKVENDYNAYFYRAVCEGAAGMLQEALADYTVCIDNGFELFQSYSQRAEIYAAMGDTENWDKDLRESLKYAE